MGVVELAGESVELLERAAVVGVCPSATESAP
jgi:hypothetical protein